MSQNHIAVFPGTFDPATKGHLDLIQRSSSLFSNLIVAVANNPHKHTMFSLEQRVAMLEEEINHQGLKNVEVHGFVGMLPDFLQSVQATVLVRGVRSILDCDYEMQLTGMYHTVLPKLQIIMLPSNANLSCISSTIVRDIIRHNGDIRPFVPEGICQNIEKYGSLGKTGKIDYSFVLPKL